MAKTLIITGAGASCDWLTKTNKALVEFGPVKVAPISESHRTQLVKAQTCTPPLTKDLVSALEPLGAGCSQLLELINHYERSSTGAFDFEQTLRTIHKNRYSEFETEFQALRIALNKLLSKADHIGENLNTLYTSLYARIRGSSIADRNTLTINLNYDRLAEFAITHRQGFNNLDDYISNDTGNLLFHPHGNCSWHVRAEETGMPDKMQMDQSVVNWIYKKSAPPDSQPCLAIPMSGDYQGKTAWPKQHANKLKSSLKDIENIIVIGWRGADDHIVDIISQHIGIIKNLHIVSFSPSGTDECESNISSINKAGITPIKIAGGFRRYITSQDFFDLFPLP